MKVIVRIERGLHVRSIATIKKMVDTFDTPCYLLYKNKKYNLKQMFKLTAAGITCGSIVDIECSNKQNLKTIADFISTPTYS